MNFATRIRLIFGRSNRNFDREARGLLVAGFKAQLRASSERKKIKISNSEISKLLKKMGNKTTSRTFRAIARNKNYLNHDFENLGLITQSFRKVQQTKKWDEGAIIRLETIVRSLEKYSQNSEKVYSQKRLELQRLYSVLLRANEDYLELTKTEKSSIATMAILDPDAADIMCTRFRACHVARRTRVINFRRELVYREGTLAELKQISQDLGQIVVEKDGWAAFEKESRKCKATKIVTFKEVAFLHGKLDRFVEEAGNDCFEGIRRKNKLLFEY